MLGIISCICCPIVGPVALFIGNASRRRVEASGGTLGGGGMATAGLILGIIGTVLLVLLALFILTTALGVWSATRTP